MVGSQRQWNLSREGRQVIKITRPPGDDLTRHRTAYDGATARSTAGAMSTSRLDKASHGLRRCDH